MKWYNKINWYNLGLTLLFGYLTYNLASHDVTADVEVYVWTLCVLCSMALMLWRLDKI